MGKPTGFIDFARVPLPKRAVPERVRDWQEFLLDWDPQEARHQAGRCMNCAVPMCHSYTGCPLGNIIPDWNDFVYEDQWDQEAPWATDPDGTDFASAGPPKGTPVEPSIRK